MTTVTSIWVPRNEKKFQSGAGNNSIARRALFRGIKKFPPFSFLTQIGICVYIQSISTTLNKHIYFRYSLLNECFFMFC